MDVSDKIISLIELKKYEAALHIVEEELSADPENDHLYYLGSLCLEEQEEYNESKVFIESAIELNPEETTYKIKLAELHISLLEYKACSQLLSEIVPEEGDELENFYRVKTVLSLIRQDYHEAIELSLKILAINPSSFSANSFLAYGRMLEGKLDEANSIVESVLSEEPESYFARYVLVLIQLKGNKVEVSKDMVLSFLSEDPTNVIYIDALRQTVLSRNSASRLMLKFQYFLLRKAGWIQSFSQEIFRVILVITVLICINSDFYIPNYTMGLLFAHIIFILPTKTIPTLQIVFLWFSEYRSVLLSKDEFGVSLYSLIFFVVGLLVFYFDFFEFNNVAIGLLALYLSGLVSDYIRSVIAENRTVYLAFFISLNALLVILLIANYEWSNVALIGVIAWLFFYPIWIKRISRDVL